jgi:hypothetical protein
MGRHICLQPSHDVYTPSHHSARLHISRTHGEVGILDSNRGIEGQSPDINEGLDGFSEAIVKVVFPQHARDPGVGQNVRVPRLLLTGRVGPVLLGAS